MIRLTRRNNDAIVINLTTIAYVEATPDTLITLTTGERIHVREPLETVVAAAIAYQRRVVSPFTAGAPSGEHAKVGNAEGVDSGDGIKSVEIRTAR